MEYFCCNTKCPAHLPLKAADIDAFIDALKAMGEDGPFEEVFTEAKASAKNFESEELHFRFRFHQGVFKGSSECVEYTRIKRELVVNGVDVEDYLCMVCSQVMDMWLGV